jgi:hypothetical protein
MSVKNLQIETPNCGKITQKRTPPMPLRRAPVWSASQDTSCRDAVLWHSDSCQLHSGCMLKPQSPGKMRGIPTLKIVSHWHGPYLQPELCKCRRLDLGSGMISILLSYTFLHTYSLFRSV